MNVQIARLIALGLTLAINSTRGGELGVAPPRDLPDLIKLRLPPNWTCRTEGTSLVVRPEKGFVFVNLINADGGRRGETRDEYRRRHIVKIDYRIALRFVPRVAAHQVRDMIKTNETAETRLRAIEKDQLAEQDKGRFKFSETSKGRRLASEYETLKRSRRSIPCGHRGSVTVYIEPTFLGYARFFREEDNAECDSVLKELRTLFTPYDADTANMRR